jgi:glutathione S-transferase
MTDEPILYSFRRCPYAMRARLAILSSGIKVELREIVLRDKAPEFLDTSPSGTVPCLKVGKKVIDESLHVMAWALAQNDPQEWMQMPTEGYELMAQCDGPFKHSLDRTKYGTRYPDESTSHHRELASAFMRQLNDQLSPNLFGDKIKLADMAILPFVRQFAHIDQAWFYAQPWPKVIAWLDAFKASETFNAIMPKYPKWHAGDVPVYFP